MEYNKIYKQLVTDEHNPDQVFAYCVYKKRKIAYIEKLKAEKIAEGKKPEVSYREVKGWVDKLTETDLNSYRKDGSDIVSNIHSSLIQQAIEKEKDKILGDLVAEIKNKRFKDYAKDVMIGVLSSIIASVIFTKCSSSEVQKEEIKKEQTTKAPKHPEFNQAPSKTAK